MEKFAYANPTTEKEAFGLLGPDAAVLAGGTDLISSMKELIATPKTVVNVKGIKSLGGIATGRNGMRIGATVTLDELAENAAVRKAFPSLTEAALGITSPQIRNMGTVGGDLLQRPRCWYYRQGFGLLAMQNGKSLVPDGENRYHAILNNKGPAYFVSPSSLAPALIALNATIRLHSAAGLRDVPAEKFFITPLNEQTRETAIQPNEILAEILIPTAPTANATYEVRQKEALDWPLATASVALKMSGNRISSARVVLGHVAPVPFSAIAADKYLAGKSLNDNTAAEAAKEALMSATPLSQNAYKVQLARVAVKRALLAAVKKA
ncbi:MAG: xanthine dehydrogenase family protein subunit M [Acidobacteriota bacterium]|nr:xanthine dehydrogenase family protein subunit M [Acidobacteriota bacterium]